MVTEVTVPSLTRVTRAHTFIIYATVTSVTRRLGERAAGPRRSALATASLGNRVS
jgi:hypothetical protein